MAMMPGMDPEQMAQLVAEMTGKMVAGQLQQEEDHLDGMLAKLENMDSDDMDSNDTDGDIDDDGDNEALS